MGSIAPSDQGEHHGPTAEGARRTEATSLCRLLFAVVVHQQKRQFFIKTPPLPGLFF